jgi:hypothetical protein
MSGHKSVPTAKQFEDAAFSCAVLLVFLLACVVLDGFDGVVETKARTYRFLDDPAGFRSALLLRWGMPTILAAFGTIALGIGALVVKGSEKASTDQ